MTFTECADCKEVKTGGQQQRPRCKVCANKKNALKMIGNTRGVGQAGWNHSSESCLKMSESQKCNKNAVGNTNFLGKNHSLETRQKISLSKGGDGEVLNRKYPGINTWTRHVKERDGYKCAECGYQGTKGKRDVDAHHVLPKVKFPELATVLFNGVTLCKPCHKEIHR